MPIDTHQTYRRLVAAGFPEGQTEGQAEGQAEIFADWTSERLVTREYLDSRLRELELNFDKKLLEQDARFKAALAEQDARFQKALADQSALFERRLAELRTQLTVRIFTAVGLGVAVLSAVIALLGYLNPS